MATPMNSLFGKRVSRTTTSSGIKKIRKMVRRLGRFMNVAPFPLHYSQGGRRCQREDSCSAGFLDRRDGGAMVPARRSRGRLRGRLRTGLLFLQFVNEQLV